MVIFLHHALYARQFLLCYHFLKTLPLNELFDHPYYALQDVPFTRFPIRHDSFICLTIAFMSVFSCMCCAIIYATTFDIIIKFYSTIIVATKCTNTCLMYIIALLSQFFDNFIFIPTPIIWV